MLKLLVNTNDSTCARTANFNNFTGSSAPSYSLSQSLFTSGCADATAVVFSNVVTLRKGGKGALESEFSLVSNRVTSDLVVAFTTLKSGTANWQVLNFNGQVVFSGNGEIPAGSGQFSVTGLEPLPAGLYLIRITGENFPPKGVKFEHL